MFKKSSANNNNGSNNSGSNVVSTIIGEATTLSGGLQFSGGLLVEGRVVGDISSTGDDAILILEETGRIEGEVTVHNIIVNGTVKGDIHVSNQAELSANAVIHGNVYYDKLEMLNGARINGSLVHQSAPAEPAAVSHEQEDTEIDGAAVENT